MELRTDIQILRGLAVTFVVLFHLEIVGLSSGFLGVDVFFVLSGFLMAILYKKGEMKSFYQRRAKRLIPAYFATVILTLFASLFVVYPSELGQVVSQSIYSLLFANNIGFWMQNSYFSKTDFNPLLHLWSLGVEIQFYLIVPLLVWLFSKFKTFLPLAIMGSFCACIFIVGISPKTSFFMMPLRMWEFLIGFAVAYYLTVNGSVKYKNLNLFGFIGLCILIAIPFMNVDGQSLNRMFGHPSFYALAVCLSTAIIITFGLPKLIVNSFIGKLFSKIGDYSYSIYLVHFPIIVLYLYEPFSGTKLYPEIIFDKIILLILITIISILMHKFIERKHIKNISKTYGISFVSLLLLIGVSNISPYFYSQKQKNIFNSVEDRDLYRCGKIVRITDPTAITCKINSEKFNDSILLLGNSHADSIKSIFSLAMTKNRYNTYFFINNDPMIGSVLPPKEIINEAIYRKISWIFLHYKSGTLDLNKLNELVELSEKNNIKITLILPVPIYENNSYYEGSIPKTLFLGKISKLSNTDYLTLNKDLLIKVNELKVKFKNFDSLSVSQEFCSPICNISTLDLKPYYFDDDHLTLTGAKKLGPLFESISIINSHNDK